MVDSVVGMLDKNQRCVARWGVWSIADSRTASKKLEAVDPAAWIIDLTIPLVYFIAPLIWLKQLVIISIRSSAVLTRTSECLISRLSNNYILHHRSTIYIQESLLVHLVACSSTSRALRSCVDVDGDVLFKEGMEWTAVQSACNDWWVFCFSSVSFSFTVADTQPAAASTGI